MQPSHNRATLLGPRVILRAPRTPDKASRSACGNDPEFIYMLGGDRSAAGPCSDESVQQWYERVESNPLHWMVVWETRCVGTALLHDLRTDDRNAMYAISLFDPGIWNRGIGREVTRLVLWYAFEVVQLHRVSLRVLRYNQRAIHVYQTCGFVWEGIERESASVDGVWESDVIMGILEEEYREAVETWPQTEYFRAMNE